MRHNDIRPQAYVACFDTTAGRMRWRRFVCAAETPARGMLAECTHTLLTLAGDTIYVNTNLGAVAARWPDDGHIIWISLYPRARSGNLARLDAHWQRDLNPCVFDRGQLYVAPADSPRFYALDAATGQILWPGTTQRSGDRPSTPCKTRWTMWSTCWASPAIASSPAADKLYWIELAGPRAGNIAHVWPEGDDKPGYGRGVLAGRLRPLAHARQDLRLSSANRGPAQEIDLAPLGLRGGNLLVSDGHLLIATSGELVLLRTNPGTKKEPSEITQQIRIPPRHRFLP